MPQMNPSPSGRIHMPDVSNTSGMAAAIQRRADHERLCVCAARSASAMPASAAMRPEAGPAAITTWSAVDPLAARGAHRGGAACDGIDRNSLVVDVARAIRDCVGAHCAQQTVGVEPALVLQTQRGAGQTLRVQPREMRSESGRLRTARPRRPRQVAYLGWRAALPRLAGRPARDRRGGRDRRARPSLQ